MAATIQIIRKCGASGATTTDITGINTRANTTDTHSTNDTSYPIKIPTAGSDYSYWVSTRLNCTVSPVGTINNLRWYTDGANGFGTGVTCVVAKASTGANAGYRQATGTSGETGIELTQGNHSGLDAAPVDAFGKTVAAPLSLTGTITNPTTGEFGDHVVYQVAVDSTAGTGATNAETFSWKYDET
jgi:hypothetical protein